MVKETKESTASIFRVEHNSLLEMNLYLMNMPAKKEKKHLSLWNQAKLSHLCSETFEIPYMSQHCYQDRFNENFFHPSE